MSRPHGKRAAVRLSIGFDEHIYGTLSALAHRNDTTVAWIVRRAVVDFIASRPAGDQPELPLFNTRKVGDQLQ